MIFDDSYQVWAMDVVELVLAAQIGDFEGDVLCRWTSRGPPHQSDEDAGHRFREITRECAVLTGRAEIADLRRPALEQSFGMLVVSCDRAELERDPFAVAYRVLNELRIRVHDDSYGKRPPTPPRPRALRPKPVFPRTAARRSSTGRDHHCRRVT